MKKLIALLAANRSGTQTERPYQGNLPPGSIRVEVSR